MLFIVSSCRKYYDYIHDHPDAPDHLCRMTQIRAFGFVPAGADTFDVIYNAKGDPTDIVEKIKYPIIDNWDQHYRYDQNGRLSAYYINFPPALGSPDGAISYHKYAYPRKNFVTDTLTNYSSDFPPNYTEGESSIQGYLLDDKGRIIKIYTLSIDPHQPPQLVSEISYDANGNRRLGDPTLTYDHMVNPHRISYTFQFVYNDFSRNNLVSAGTNPYGIDPAYNQAGLPVVLPFTAIPPTILPFGMYSVKAYYIDYACAAPKGPLGY